MFRAQDARPTNFMDGQAYPLDEHALRNLILPLDEEYG